MNVPSTYIATSFNRQLMVVIVFFCLVSTTSAQNLSANTKAKFVSKFPFSLTTRGIIIIKGGLGKNPAELNFVLDTGCGGISLDSATARQLNLEPLKSEQKIKGLSQLKQAEFITGQQLRLQNLRVDSLDFHINDYSFLSESNNIKIDGVIGYSFLKHFIVNINYSDFTIEIWRPGNYSYPKNGFIIPADVNKLVSVNAMVKDRRKIDTRFYFDTGADICFIFSEKFARDSNLLSNGKKIVVSGGEGLGGKQEMRLTTIDELRLGPYTLHDVPAYIYEDPYNVFNYPFCGGIIGNELLQRFNLVLNYPQNEVHLEPNRMFDDPFNYAYFGCSISTTDGRLIIKDIIKDSPAEIAGLQDEDVIFGINDNFKNDIFEYSKMLYKPGAKVRIFYLRDKKVKSTVVEVGSIL
jgi:predicted aspartyl protease